MATYEKELRGHFWYIVKDGQRARPVRKVQYEATADRLLRQFRGEDEPPPAPKPSPAALPISALMLSESQVERLNRAGILTVAELEKYSRDELLDLPGVGAATVAAVVAALAVRE
jgi:DNA-directed RNA polymerase alpha subunit